MKLLLFVPLLMLAACGGSASVETLTGSAMGTTYSITVKGRPAVISLNEVGEELTRLLESIEAELSTYRPESGLSQFNASTSTDWQPVSQLLCDSVAATLEISLLSDGSFDVTVGPLVDLWGFGAEGMGFEPPEDALVEETLAVVGYENLEADCEQPAIRKAIPELRVDLSGWAKGYAVDRLAERLNELFIDEYLVEVGGELRTRGTNASGDQWVIAIESPDPGSRSVYATIGVSDLAVATSGDYRNFFEYEGTRYSHMIDSDTGRPVTHELASVTIVHPSAAFADAVATAVHVLGPTDGYALVEREGIAALLLSYGEQGISGRATPGFARLGPRT